MADDMGAGNNPIDDSANPVDIMFDLLCDLFHNVH